MPLDTTRRTVTHTRTLPALGTLALILNSCDGAARRSPEGKYALVGVEVQTQGRVDSASAGTEGTYGSLQLHAGGKLEGETKLPALPERVAGTWFNDSAGLHFALDSAGDSVKAELRADGMLILRRDVRDPREEFWLSAMKSDLRNLVRSEESYFSDMARYITSLRELNFKPSSGVNAPKITIVSAGAFHATVTHSLLPGAICGIGMLTDNTVDRLAPEAEAVCKVATQVPWGRITYTFRRSP